MPSKELHGFLFFNPGYDPDAVEFVMGNGRAVGVLVRESDGWRSYILCGDHQHAAPRACADLSEARSLFVKGFVQQLRDVNDDDDDDDDASNAIDPSEAN